MIPLAAFALGGCLAVGAGSDQIVAGDLTERYPEWAAIPAATPLGLAPAPGVQRVLRLPELRRLAEHWSVSPAPVQDICVTRPVTALTEDRLLAAMQREMPAAHIAIADFSRLPAPDGELVFPVSGLRQGPEGGYWNGYVTYGVKHRFALWARVKVTVAAPRVVATRAIQPGLPLDGALVRVETREEVPAAGLLSSLEEAAGMIARRAIAAGTPLRTEWLEPAKVVLRGETVEVEAVHGGARLKLDCVAEASGAVGETIAVRNPISQQRFQARVASKGRAVVAKGTL